MQWEYFEQWGGMPVLTGEGWTDEDRFEWLADYQATYLQRDLGDLVQLERLEPFVRAQQAVALRTARSINFSELARLADVAPATAKKFVRFLEISYQVLMLPAWFRNPEKRLMKQPRLHFVDPGIRRAILRKRGAVDGAEFESAVVAEIFKQCRTARLPVDFWFLRTADGREVDLLIEREDGFVAVEVKQAERIGHPDFRHLRGLGEILDKPLLLGLVVSHDSGFRQADEPRLWNAAVAHLLT
jgi:predicted AAA+ superfamily ATPase